MRQFTTKGEEPFDLRTLTRLGHTKGVAVDIETTGLERTDTIRLVQFASPDETVVAFAPENDEDVGLLRGTVRAMSWPLVFNAPFDLRHLCGADPWIWPEHVDVRLAWKLVRPDLDGGLKALAQDVLYRMPEEQAVLKTTMRSNKWTWATVPVDLLVPYGLADAVYTRDLWHEWKRVVGSGGFRELMRVEHDVQRLMASVGEVGFRFDTAAALDLRSQYESRIAEAETLLRAEGIENPGSVPQVKAVLDRLGIAVDGTSRTALQSIDHPFVTALLAWRTYRKWIASYIMPCIDSAAVDGRVHAHYQSFGARTGRMSCANPPLQQMPTRASKDIRGCFQADHGHEHVVSVDYDQIELRLAAAFSGDKVLVQAFRSGADPYQATAEELQVDRHTAKTLMLGALYGAGPAKIATILRVSLNEAKTIHRKFWRVHGGLHEWVQAAQLQSRPHTWYGRPLRPVKPYHSPNAIIQGTAADIMKRGLLAIAEHSPSLRDRIRAVIHDEIVFSMDLKSGASPIHQTLNMVEMTIHGEAKVDISASYTIYGPRWGQPRSDSGNTQSSDEAASSSSFSDTVSTT